MIATVTIKHKDTGEVFLRHLVPTGPLNHLKSFDFWLNDGRLGWTALPGWEIKDAIVVMEFSDDNL